MNANDKLTSDLLEGIESDSMGTVSFAEWHGTPDAQMILDLLPGARTIVAFAQEIPVEVIRHTTWKADVGAITMRDLYSQTAELVNGRMDWEAYKLVKHLHQSGYRGLSIPYGGPYDPRFLTGVFSYKHAAQTAGLGNLGWNAQLLTPEFGPRVRLTCVLTDAELHLNRPELPELPCIKCQGACVKICPSKAISYPVGDEPYNVNAHACNSFLSGVKTCAECIRVCPAGLSR